MQPLLTVAAMRRLEAEALRRPDCAGGALMERAARAVLSALWQYHPPFAAGQGRRALVLCGPGNNGGDGYVIARLLAARGWQVALCAVGDPARLPADAARARAEWVARGAVRTFDEAPRLAETADLLVDAVLGLGLTRPVSGALAAVFERLARRHEGRVPLRVAVDIPSGLDGDSGTCAGACLAADLTVTFAAAKPGHHLARGPALCGALVVADLGIGSEAPEGGTSYPPPRSAAPPAMLLKRTGHKFDHGHALVLGGGVGRGGAARLAAGAALRAGAGLVTLAPPPAALIENAARLDAVMLRALADGPALARMLEEDRRISALCLGPGLGLDARAEGLLGAALASLRPAVLDADALTLLSRRTDPFAALHAGCVLTPHAGEFARLFPDLARALDTGKSKLEVTADAADRAGCSVLLKGPDTVIAAPGGATWISSAAYERAAPWLATAGAGDVLAGMIAGLLARKAPPEEAAQGGAWLHLSCALSFGPGLTAEDIANQVPAVLRSLP